MIYSHEVQHMCVVKKGANHPVSYTHLTLPTTERV